MECNSPNSQRVMISDHSRMNSSPSSDISDCTCSNENIIIDNSEEESLPPSPYATDNNNLRKSSGSAEVFNKSNKPDGSSSNSSKLMELQIDNVPSVIVPRTVPCIVLTPPAIFNPGLPLLSFSSVPERLSADYLHDHRDRSPPAHLPTTSAFVSIPLTAATSGNNKACCDDIKDFKTENSLNLSQSCKNELDGDARRENSPKKLAFGIDRILSSEKEASLNLSMDSRLGPGHPVGLNLKSYHSHHEDHLGGESYSSQCSECFFLSRYCRRIQFPTASPVSVSSPSFAWIPPPTTSHSVDSNSTLLSSNGFGQHLHFSSYGLNASSFSNMSSVVSCNTNGSGRRKRSWSRAVFSNLQRKGLEKRFQLQKYITKPDRRQLAATLGLTDAQVKVWFQNRRMKWRHSKEGKQGTHIAEEPITVNSNKN